MSRSMLSDAQCILDIMFEILSVAHGGEAPKDRDECMDWARDQLRKCGFDVIQMGSSHAVIREPVLCPDDQDWDWWLKLPPAHKGAMVKHYRSLVKELTNG